MNKYIIKHDIFQNLTDSDLLNLFLITIKCAEKYDIKMDNDKNKHYYTILKDQSLLELGIDNDTFKVYLDKGKLSRINGGIIGWDAIMKYINNQQAKESKKR